MNRKNIAILGSTGSIGTQALEIIRRFPEQFKITVLAAGSDEKLLKEQAAEFKPEIYGLGKDISLKAEHLKDTDIVLIAVGGFAALPYIMEAAKAGKRIALANKESLVAAGDIIMDCAVKHGAEIIPVDSEHSAIFQCLRTNGDGGIRCAQQMPSVPICSVKRIILTASGGPLLNAKPDELKDVTPQRVIKHPRWNMGKKISADSATMMNKGLEVIEAHYLFNVPPSQIDVVIHPQSVVHSMVEFIDGSVMAQMSYPDMRVPISRALFYPERCPDTGTPFLDFNTLGSLQFMPLDKKQFPCFELALYALEKGGVMPCVLNAADEAAVELFLKGKIPYLKISEIIESVLAKYNTNALKNPCIDDIINIDREVKEYIKKQYVKGIIKKQDVNLRV